MAVFRIADGDPDITMSDSIWCKRTLNDPMGWTETDVAPPGEFEDPFFREDGWVWVQVSQVSAVLSDQNAFLHLFAALVLYNSGSVPHRLCGRQQEHTGRPLYYK